MAADSIKHIAAFSSDGITQALHRLFPDKDKQDVFTAKLTELAGLLEKPAKIAKMDSRNVIPSAKTVFEKCILPQIRTKLTEYEQLEFVGRDVCWKVELNFRTDFNEMDAGELKLEHSKIVMQEKIIQGLDLVVKYQRGMLYLAAYKTAQECGNFRKWFRVELGVVYRTALRYMSMSLLLKRYPRLIVCGLSFSQLVKHNKRLSQYLASETEGLKDRLCMSINISTQDQPTDITPSEVLTPKMDNLTDPDLIYEDYFYDPAWDDIPDDDECSNWLQQLCDTGEIFDIIFPSDEDPDIEQVSAALKDMKP